MEGRAAVTEETKGDASSPSIFRWTIQSFSSFSKLKVGKYYSGDFSAGGCKWNLLVYPKGNNVDDHLSLYLELVDSASLSPDGNSASLSPDGADICVDFTLSLLDQVLNKHKKSSGTQEWFRAGQTTRGFTSFVPLGILNDPSKGYLVDDTCLFQAEVTVHGGTQSTPTVCEKYWVGLTLEKAISNKFSWKIDGFSKLQAKRYESEAFTAGNYNWKMALYPKGSEAGHLSLYVVVADSAKLARGWQVYAEYSLSLLDQVHGKHKMEKAGQWFNAQKIGFGAAKFIPLSDLRDPTTGFLVNDTCIVEAEVALPRLVDYCSYKSKKKTSYASSCLAKVWDSPCYKFRWSIDKFSQLNVDKLHSDIFTTSGYKWRLMLAPKADNVDQLSLYLEVVESDTLPNGWRIYAQFAITLVNVGNKDSTITKDTWHQFSAQESCWGFREFMPLSILYNKSTGYLADGRLLVEVEVSVHRAVDYWTYDSRKVMGCVGLKNSGSNSFFNCYLQTLYHIPYFRKAIFHVPRRGSYLPSFNIVQAMQNLFRKLENSGICISTKYLNGYFGCNTYDSCMRRHDMHVLIGTLFGQIEDEIRGTVIEAKIKQLFGSQFLTYIKCISREYKSEWKESFSGLLLDVKGCRDVYSSFELFVKMGHRDDASKFHSEQHVMQCYPFQDSRNGVLFVNFPPVLQLVLKRFEFDSVQNTMVKIDDFYGFPLELDLDKEKGKYLSFGTVGMIRNLYTLYSIVVHTGRVHGGHCYCLVRPNLSDQWVKFEDGRVTKVDVNVLSQKFWGSEGQAIYSNVCMLVYIRKCDKDMVFSSEVEVDYTDQLRLDKGQRESECKEKEKSDESMYIIIKVSRHEDFTCQIGKDIYFDLVDHENVCGFRVRNDMPFLQFKEEVAREFGVAVQFQRFWLWKINPNETCRPYFLLTCEEELKSVGKLVMDNIHMELNLFLDVELGLNLLPIPPLEKNKDDILLFFKVYDPRDENLRYAGRLYVNARDKPIEILLKLKKMASLPPDEEIELFKEIGFEPTSMCEHVDKELTFRNNMLKDGDIICYQLVLPLEERKRCLHPDVPSFLNFVQEHQMWYKRRCAKLTDQRDEMEALVVREAARRFG